MKTYLLMYAIAIWAMVSFTSCSDTAKVEEKKEETKTEMPPPIEGTIPCDFAMLSKVFKNEAEKRGHSRPIQITFKIVNKEWFMNSTGCRGSRTVACAEPGKIFVLDTYWNRASCYQREQTLFHELGHAQYGIGHVSPPPTNMMQPFTINQNYYSQFRAGILDEFIKRISSKKIFSENDFNCEFEEQKK